MKKGFTLIELLVVVAIIGVLSTVILSSLSSGVQKATDAKRVSQIRSLQGALEMYHIDNGSYPQMPNSTSSFVSNCGNSVEGDRWGVLMEMLSPYIDIPTEERSSWPNCVYYMSQLYWPCSHKSFSGYSLLVGTDSSFPSLQKWSLPSNRYCIYPL